MLKIIQLGNGGNFVQGVAHYVLGRTTLNQRELETRTSVLGLGWADNDIAIEEYKKASVFIPVILCFTLIMRFHLYARTIIKRQGRC